MDGKIDLVLPTEGEPGRWVQEETTFGICDCGCEQPTAYIKRTREICWPQTDALRIRAQRPDFLALWTESMPEIDAKLQELGWDAEAIKWQMIGLETTPVSAMTPGDREVFNYLAQELRFNVVEVDASFGPIG